MPIGIARVADQHPTLHADSLLSEGDTLDEHHLAVIVLDGVVAVESVAVLIEVVDAIGALVALHAQDRPTDLLRPRTLSVVDREREKVNRVVR